jgi:Tfp pilus assembly protein PilO
LNNRKRYTILAVLFLFTVYLFNTYFLLPERENYRETLAGEYKKLQRYEFIVKEAGTTEAGIESLIYDMQNTEARLVPGNSDFLATARIQSEIGKLTGATGLNVASIRPMDPVKMSAYTAIPVYFEGNGNITQLSEFLRAVETNQLLLKIDKLSLNITNMQKPDDLKFKIQISGLSKI